MSLQISEVSVRPKEWRRSLKILAYVLAVLTPIIIAGMHNGSKHKSVATLIDETALVTNAYAAFPQREEITQEEVEAKSTRAEITERRKDMCIGAMIWGEARGEPLTGRYMAGYVGHMRAVDKWFGSDNPCVQVCKKGSGKHREFDGTKQFCAQIESAFKKGGQLPTVPEEFIKIAHEVRVGTFQPPEECRKARYFANFAESSPGGIKYFQKNTRIRCVFGDHLFAEDRPQVRKAIARIKPVRHKRAKPNIVQASVSAKQTKLRTAHR